MCDEPESRRTETEEEMKESAVEPEVADAPRTRSRELLPVCERDGEVDFRFAAG